MPTAPVLAVVVCHDGEAWLPFALSALARSSVRPRHVVAVDTGSTDRTAALLAEASTGTEPAVDSVLKLSPDAGFAEAVAAGVQHARLTFDAADEWLWLLHDDCAPEPDCLASLLNAVDASPSSGVLGPLAVDWNDPRLIVEAGLSTDASGHRHNGMGIDNSGNVEQSSEVLAVASAGALIKSSLWEDLDGFDEDFVLTREDIDFGWRANLAGKTVLCVPRARLRHARALSIGERAVTAIAGGGQASVGTVLAVDRANGLRTFLLNCSAWSFVLGVPRLVVLCLLRGIGFFLIKETPRARAEFAAAGFLVRGHGQLRAGREQRKVMWQRHAASGGARRRGRGRRGGVRGLFVGRFTRLRFAVRAAVLNLVRRRVASEAALGRLPESTSARSTWVPPEELRAAAFTGGRTRGVVAVPFTEDGMVQPPEPATGEPEPAAEGAPAARRPSPGAGAPSGLVFVEVDRKRILAATLFAPPFLLVVVMTALALVVNWQRIGLDLTGGRLLPVGDLGEVWSSYLAGWHPAGGGTSAQAPTALAVLGVFGAVLYPLGGPAAAVALLFLLDIPLAALSAYAATRRLRVHRWVRALLASVYAVLPPATAAVAQGRTDVVVVHILLPLVIAGLARVLRPEGWTGRPGSGERWLSVSVVAALGLAVLGAFSPFTYLMVLVGVLLGFVLVHSTVRLTRRVAGLAVLVLLPMALLLPWPTTLITHPELVLHGIGARVAELRVSGGELFSLDPGGAGALPIGAMLVAAALIALVIRSTWRAMIGVGFTLIGAAGVAVLVLIAAEPAAGGAPRHGWTGAPLLVVGIGLLSIMLAAAHRERGAHRPSSGSGPRLPQRLAVGAGVGGLVVIASAGVLVGGEGPLRSAESVRMAAPLAAELDASGRSVLDLSGGGEPPRMAGGGMPSFGDDDLPLPPETPERLATWQQVLLAAPGGEPNAVRDTVALASAAGVLFVVVPPEVGSAGIVEAGGELVTTAAPLADGRQVVRLKPTGGQVTLIAPELSKLAVGGKPPVGDIESEGVAVVDAELPNVRVRVSDGPGGRLLVLAATHEAGWRASVNGRAVPIVPAWGHQVGVEVPTRAADVAVENPATVRSLLLLVQVGALLFTALTAIPARRSRG